MGDLLHGHPVDRDLAAQTLELHVAQVLGGKEVGHRRLRGFADDERDYGVGIQILKDLGLSSVRLMTNNPKKVDAFIYSGYGLAVTEQVPIEQDPNEFNQDYLKTKRVRMGHRLNKLDKAERPDEH